MGEWPRAMVVETAQLTLASVCRLLEAESLVEGDGAACVRAIGASDLMSDVLALSRPGMLLLTGLVTEQAVRTAAVADLVGIVFVRDKRVPEEVLTLAREFNVPVMRTRLTMFETAGRLYLVAVEPSRAR